MCQPSFLTPPSAQFTIITFAIIFCFKKLNSLYKLIFFACQNIIRTEQHSHSKYTVQNMRTPKFSQHHHLLYFMLRKPLIAYDTKNLLQHERRKKSIPLRKSQKKSHQKSNWMKKTVSLRTYQRDSTKLVWLIDIRDNKYFFFLLKESRYSQYISGKHFLL